MDLRPYQAAGIEKIRSYFRQGIKKVLLWLATGAGKTHCFSFMMIETVQRGKRCLMIVRGRKLVDQASRRLFREGVTHGVMMSGHWNFRPSAPIQICSIDTLMARNWRPKADLIVIDEAHQAMSESYREFLADPSYANAFIVSVTATPYSNRSMRHIADEIVHPISVQELIDQGFLVPARYFAPSEPDVSHLKISRSTGDYVQSELASLMEKTSITGDVISHWKKLAENRPTLCFELNVDRSIRLAQQFCDNGIPAEHCDADTPEKERDEIIKRLEAGVTKVIVNVGIFCTGVDIPAVSCIVMVRPTASYNLYIQQAGRGTRIYPGKKDFILLDHAGNVTRHGFIKDEPDPDLNGKRTGSMGPKPKRCDQCFAIVEAFPCPAETMKRNETTDEWEPSICGWSPPAQDRGGPREVLHVDGELKEITEPSPLQKYECERYCEDRIAYHIAKGNNVWRAFYDTVEKHGDQAARLVFFRICKRNGISTEKKKKTQEVADGYPFK